MREFEIHDFIDLGGKNNEEEGSARSPAERAVPLKGAEHGRYAELLVLRDDYRKEASGIMTLYVYEFGTLLTELFACRIRCMKMERGLSYCTGTLKRRGVLDQQLLRSSMEEGMEGLNAQLARMRRDSLACRQLRTVPDARISRAKRLYRQIARMIRPEINPQTQSLEALQRLWQRTQDAYRINSVSDLESILSDTVNLLRRENIYGREVTLTDLPRKIRTTEEEIDRIVTSAPYTYKELLGSRQKIIDRKAELVREIVMYKDRCREEQGELEHWLISHGITVSFLLRQVGGA